MSLARYFTYKNEAMIRSAVNCRRFSVLAFDNASSTVQQRIARRWMSTVQVAAQGDQENQDDLGHKTHLGLVEPLLPEDHSVDWFEHRYVDKSYHEKDGLDPNEWLLLYRIEDERQRNRFILSLYGIGLGAIACGTFIFVMTCAHRSGNPFQIAPVFMLGGIMSFIYATRFRRYGVVRLYARRFEQELWERWRLEQLAKPPPQRDLAAPMRHYRIVWSDLFHKSQIFAYNSRQVSDWVHRPRFLARALNGNFLVLGRPWAVHPEFFDEPPDYIFVRRS